MFASRACRKSVSTALDVCVQINKYHDVVQVAISVCVLQGKLIYCWCQQLISFLLFLMFSSSVTWEIFLLFLNFVPN